MRVLRLAWVMAPLMVARGLHGQIPMDKLSPADRVLVQTVVQKPDFTFETRTEPVHVRVDIMEKLFDHPRLTASMWRYCQFVPLMYAFELPGQNLMVDDSRGLHGTLSMVYKQPGLRVYYIQGRVETGRMNNPFPVGAKMVITYRYWDGPKGYESHLQTWTTLDSALLSFVSRPFRGYIKSRQQEFIAYINRNIAMGGQFAQINPIEFREPIMREGDPISIRQFNEVFGTRNRVRLGSSGIPGNMLRNSRRK